MIAVVAVSKYIAMDARLKLVLLLMTSFNSSRNRTILTLRLLIDYSMLKDCQECYNPFLDLQQTSDDSSKFVWYFRARIFFTGIEREFYTRSNFL